jgi:hypothetical protein
MDINDITIPVIDSENKAILYTDNKLLPLIKVVQHNGYDLDNVLALFAPTRLIYEYHVATNDIQRKRVQARIDSALELFISIAEEYGVAYETFTTLAEWDLPNGDNALTDSHRLHNNSVTLQLLAARGIDLTNFQHQITSTRKVVFEFLELTDNLENIDDVHAYIQENCPAILVEYPEFAEAPDPYRINLFKAKAQWSGLRAGMEEPNVYFPFEDMLTVEVDAL